MSAKTVDNSPKFDQRPWGTFTVLDEGDNFKVKRIEVLPGKRLSYQKHAQRAEHWVVVRGTAKVTLDDRDIEVKSGEAIDIAVGSAHRVENPAGTETPANIRSGTAPHWRGAWAWQRARPARP